MHTLRELEAGAARRLAVLTFRAQRALGRGVMEAGAATGQPWNSVYQWAQRVARVPDAELTDAHLATRGSRKEARRAPVETHLAPAHVDAIRRWLIVSNRDWQSGSVPAAVKQAIRAGDLPAELGAKLLARERAGRSMLTDAQMDAVRINPATVRAFRNPREAWLDHVHAPGSLMLTVDPATGAERPIAPGEAWTIDDGTINFIACVPTEDPAWPFHVMPGRFQLLLIVDHRSYFIPSFTFTARPRDSYRAEDLVAALHIAFQQHGAPKWLVLEKGISAAHLVSRALALAGVGIDRANSPHQKVVEFVFNALWTTLSFQPGQVGRFRGEEAEVTALLERCRRGAADPREHFCALADVLRAIREACAEWNDHPVNHSRYGSWVPREFWEREAPRHLRRITPEDAWKFAPTIAGPLKVRGLQIATTVRLAEDYAEKFTFQAPWLVDWIGARVNLHFNAFTAAGVAKAVLAEAWHGHRAGAVLGDLPLEDRWAKYNRRLWGYSDETDAGKLAVRRAAQALHRTGVNLCPDGKPGLAVTEVRSGTGESVTAEVRSPKSEVRSPKSEAEASPRPAARLAIPAAPRGVIHRPCRSAEEDPELAELLAEAAADETA